jgi:uncharacterized damage-inducible protein DinB
MLCQRLVVALEGTPDVLDALVGAIEPGNPVWDFRPYADRFTLREIIAHVTDYEFVWLDRLIRTRDVRGVVFERGDPSKLAVENDYEHSDPLANLKLFRERRAKIVNLVNSCNDADWLLTSTLPAPIGLVSLEYHACFVPIHDGYHTGQVTQWLGLNRLPREKE